MAAVALIQFTQGVHTDSAGKAVLGAVGDFAPVTVTNGSNTDVASWKIYMLDAPPDSAGYPPGSLPLVLAEAGNGTPTVDFTPDAIGAYRIMLEVSSSLGVVDRDIRCFGIPDARGYVRPPYQDAPSPLPLALPSGIADGPWPAKPDEQNYGSNVRGWAGNGTARQVDAFLRTYDDLPSRVVSSTPFTAVVTDPPLYVVDIDAIGGPATFNLPASPRLGLVVRIAVWGEALASRPVTITPQGGGSIGSAPTVDVLGDASLTAVHQGSNNWVVLAAGASSYLAGGIGAIARPLTSRLSDDIYVTDYMTAAEITDAYNATFLFDHQPAIQAAVDYAMYRSSGPGKAAGPRVLLPGGVMRIDRTIHLGYGTDFRSAHFVGQGLRSGGSAHEMGTGTCLVAYFDDRPAIAIQGGRSSVVRDMSILQQKEGAHIQSVINGPASMAHLDPASWVDPEFPASAGSRYAPLAGIAIDPYCGVRPVVSYPDVPYPEFLGGGAVPQYGKLHSRNILIENVDIDGFVVGVALQPCQDDANGDFIKLRRLGVIFCVWGFSWGNTQARTNAIYDSVFAYVHTAFTTTRHGALTGNPQIAVYSCSFEIGIQICEILNLNYGQGPTFTGCFCEAMYSIGKLGGGGSFRTGGVRFQSCEFGFTLWSRYGVPTWVLVFDGTTMQATLDNCFFYLANTEGGYMAFKGSGASNEDEPAKCFRLTNCQRDGQDVDLTEHYQRSAFNATMGIVVSGGSTCMDRFSVSTGHLSNIDTGAQEVPRLHSEWVRAPRVNCANVYATHIKALTAGADPGVPVRWKAASLPGADLLDLDGRLLTVDMPGVTTASLMHTGGDVGDILMSSNNGVCFLVRSRTGTELLLEAMTGFDKDGNLLESLPAVCTFVPIHCRRYSLTTVIYGDITAESEVMTNIITGPGSYADIPVHFTVGDYLVVDGDVERIIQPGDARIVSWDNSAKTITFAGDFMVTQQRRRITLWARPAMPNVP